MKETAKYFLSNWQTLLLGGIVVVSIAIFVMGIIKKFLINKIKNALIRKVVLSFSSLVVVLPITAFTILGNGLDFSHFWSVYGANAVSMILCYWVYENTALRDGLALLGKKILTTVFVQSIVTDNKPNEIVKNINNDIKASVQAKAKYKEDDLKNL